MTADFTDPLSHGLFMIFVLTWLLGFAGRIIFNPARLRDTLNDTDAASVPGYRQIRVVGLLRWPFGYLPVTGPVSMIGAIFQTAAFLTVGISVILTWLWPDTLHAFYWLPVLILVLVLRLTLWFVPRLWAKQQVKAIDA